MSPDLLRLIERRVADAVGGDPALAQTTLVEAARLATEAEAARPPLGPGDTPALPRDPR
ncbi:hypothetical protein [Falsiroseomonas sp. HW251]|uniref:hypothetical protein n=1 Tax=Falsiroseomonas sp. HW251 TaxID=3390998 RepID=UPI003D31C64D